MRIQLFDRNDALSLLRELSPAVLDDVDAGVIGFDAKGLVTVYNRRESAFSGLPVERVVGRPLFTEVAQCMNNFLVAQRYEDAQAAGQALDECIDFVLTWRMRPTPVRLRMLWAPGDATRWLLLRHAAVPPAAAAPPPRG